MVFICFLIGIYYYTVPLFPLINERAAAKVERGEESESNSPSCPTEGKWCSAEAPSHSSSRGRDHPPWTFFHLELADLLCWYFLTTLLCLFPNHFGWAKNRVGKNTCGKATSRCILVQINIHKRIHVESARTAACKFSSDYSPKRLVECL